MNVPHWVEDRLERDWTHCRGGVNKPLTPKIVPFALAEEPVRNGLVGFVERREFAQPTNAILGLLFVFALMFSAALFGTLSWGITSVLLSAVNLLLVCVFGAFVWIALEHHRSRRRELIHGSKSDTVTLYTISSDGRVYAELRAPLPECATRIHRISLGSSRGVLWSGWAVVVRVKDSNFVLACFRQQGQAEDYVLGMPEWLRRVFKGQGAALEGRATDVRIGWGRT